MKDPTRKEIVDNGGRIARQLEGNETGIVVFTIKKGSINKEKMFQGGKRESGDL